MKKNNKMKALLLMITLSSTVLFNCKNNQENNKEVAADTSEQMDKNTIPDPVKIIPINHASLVLNYKGLIIYVDPVDGVEAYSDLEKPDYILITDIHGDHFDVKTLENMSLEETTFIVPKAVKEKMPELNAKEILVMNNGEKENLDDFSLEAIPMYNLREEALQFHEKGRGNGYVLTLGNERIYISGDTEDIPEMRQLKNIDVAFLCMNLPYTMTVESAAEAILEFKPKKVYPYHYRGTEGLSDVSKFKSIVNNGNSDIEVVQLDWYK